jgi:hypothetical protein
VGCIGGWFAGSLQSSFCSVFEDFPFGRCVERSDEFADNLDSVGVEDDADLEATKRFEYSDEVYDQPLAYNRSPIRLHKYQTQLADDEEYTSSSESQEVEPQVVIVELPDYDEKEEAEQGEEQDDSQEVDQRRKRQIYEQLKSLPNGFEVDRLKDSGEGDSQLIGYEHFKYETDDPDLRGIFYSIVCTRLIGLWSTGHGPSSTHSKRQTQSRLA